MAATQHDPHAPLPISDLGWHGAVFCEHPATFWTVLLAVFGFLPALVQFVVIPAGIVISWVRHSRRWLRGWLLFALVALINMFTNDFLKMMFGLERQHPQCDASFAFPSGHAQTTGFVLAYLLIWLQPMPLAGAVSASAVAVCVLVNRLIFQFHTAADVIAGFLIGVFIAVSNYALANEAFIQ